MRAIVQTDVGAFAVDLETEEIEPAGRGAAEAMKLSLCRACSAATRSARRSSPSSTASRRSIVSHDAGITWREAGGGLPQGCAVAIAEDDPDLIVYASRNRLHVSTNGGVFWRALAVELPEIEAVALGYPLRKSRSRSAGLRRIIVTRRLLPLTKALDEGETP